VSVDDGRSRPHGLASLRVSRLYAAMQVHGWVSRQGEPTTRNYFQLRLTAEGGDVARRVGQDLREHRGHLLDLLTPKETRALTTGRADPRHGVPQTSARPDASG